MADRECLRWGLLTKQGGSVRTWKKRFFILTRENDELKFSYYKPKGASTGRKKKAFAFFSGKKEAPTPPTSPAVDDNPHLYTDDHPLGCFYLSRLQCFHVYEMPEKGKRMLRIFAEQRVFYMFADTDQELEPWIYAIRETLQSIDTKGNLAAPIRMKGELKKRPSLRRWFVLSGDVLLYYPPDTQATVDPRGAFVVEGATAFPITTESPSAFDFDIRCKRHTLRLSAPSYLERQLWLQHLETAGCTVLPHPPPSLPSSSSPSSSPRGARRHNGPNMDNMDSDASDDDESEAGLPPALRTYEIPVTRDVRARTAPPAKTNSMLPTRDAFNVWAAPTFLDVHNAFEPACLASLLKTRQQQELLNMSTTGMNAATTGTSPPSTSSQPSSSSSSSQPPSSSSSRPNGGERPDLLRQSRVDSVGLKSLSVRWARTASQPASSDTLQRARKNRGAAVGGGGGGGVGGTAMKAVKEGVAVESGGRGDRVGHGHGVEDDGDDKQQQQQQQQQQPCRPALFKMHTDVTDERGADRFDRVRTTLLAGVRGGTVVVGVSKYELPPAGHRPVTLVASNIDRLHVVGDFATVIKKLSLRDVRHVLVSSSVTLHDVQRVQSVWLPLSPASSSDVSSVVGIPNVNVEWQCGWRTRFPSDALTSSVNTLIAAATDSVKLTDLFLLADTAIHARRVRLDHMQSVPDQLHLPNTTYIELLAGSGVKQFTCPARLQRLVIDEVMGSPPAIPDFEHAAEVRLNLRHALTRDQLSSLGRRVDMLVLAGNTVSSMQHVAAIPRSVYVCLEDVHVEGMVPPCVRELKVEMRGDISASAVASVPRLHVIGRKDPAPTWCIHDCHLLSERKGGATCLEHLAIDGEISNCDHLALQECRGSVAVASIGSFTAIAAFVGVDMVDETGVEYGPRAFGDWRARPRKRLLQRPRKRLLHLTCVRDVASCELIDCTIRDFSRFRGVQRLVLDECRFDSLDNLPPIPCLVVRACYTSDNVQWPDAVFVQRPVDDMRRRLGG